ncbi:MAG TPA: MlaD family protein [Myxococcales bacterium]|nr:MlaD family protein [Myxococcales bacterium]
MARQARKTLIGAFVVGAVALVAAGITVFGSGKFFQKRLTFVMFFSGSITGLSIGSPVEFRGVKVGKVTNIAAVFDPKALTITIPVYVEVDPKSLIVSGVEDASNVFATQNLYEPLLEKGLKAQLDIESFITRQLYINMDFYPDKPAKLLGLDPRYPEIPTIPSLQEQIVQTLQKLPEKIINVAEGIERLVNSPAAQQSLRDLDGLIKGVANEVKPLMASLTGTSDAAHRTFAQAEKTLSLKEGPSADMAASFTDTMKKAGASLDQMRSTLDSYQQVATQNANVGYDLTKTLAELDAAARSVRSLAEYLELHPEAVLKGKR